MTKYLVVDPPEGWRYGFPKSYGTFEDKAHPQSYQLPDNQWFLDQGYPQSLIDQGMLKHCRWWLHEEKDDERT